jgi:hypothetical protein
MLWLDMIKLHTCIHLNALKQFKLRMLIWIRNDFFLQYYSSIFDQQNIDTDINNVVEIIFFSLVQYIVLMLD